MGDDNREILSAALSAHLSELRLFWRETGISCRWLVPDGEHCCVDEEALKHLRRFRDEGLDRIVNPDVRRQWLEKGAPLLDGEDASAEPFPLRTLTWLLRVVESPHRDDLSTDSWNLYLWSVRMSDLPGGIMARLADYIDEPGRQSILDFDTLASKCAQALDALYPWDSDAADGEERVVLVKRFDRLRRFHNLVFFGVANIGKANISKQLIGNWKAMTGREIGMHCVTAFHPSLRYGDMVERRAAGMPRATRLDAPAVVAHHIHDARYFFAESAADIEDGMLVSLCREAALNPGKDFVFMIDCIDTARLDVVLGEVSHMLDSFARVPWDPSANGGAGAWNLEAPGARTIRLSQSGRLFFIPSNVYILGTANEGGLFAGDVDDHLFQTFAMEYLQPRSAADLRSVMLRHRTRSEFARLLDYVTHSVDLWDKINAVLIMAGGHSNVIGYGPLLSMCEELLQSGDVLDANRIALGTWRYRMMPPIRVKLDALLHGNNYHRNVLKALIDLLNASWLRMHVAIEGLTGSESIFVSFDPEP